MITLGQYHTLPVLKSLDFGFYLDAADLGEVLLPRKYAPPGLQVGDELQVFLYLDSEDRPVATTEHPKACVGEFAHLLCVGVAKVGAFLDWGLAKDVLVPFAEQQRPMEEGRSYLVFLYLDKHDGRIAASSKLDKFLSDDRPHSYHSGQSVELLVGSNTDLGTKVIIENAHWGLLHHDDIDERISFGERLQGFIKRVRPDGKIDVSLRASKEILDDNASVIERWLLANDGFSAIHDKSAPEDIDRVFGMSKAAFKKAVGVLLSAGRIALEPNGLRITADSERRSRAATSVPGEVREVEINTEVVELFKVLKFEGLAGTGGEAKLLIEDGLVLVNGKVETQKRKKLREGDIITIGDESLRLVAARATTPAAAAAVVAPQTAKPKPQDPPRQPSRPGVLATHAPARKGAAKPGAAKAFKGKTDAYKGRGKSNAAQERPGAGRSDRGEQGSRQGPSARPSTGPWSGGGRGR